MLTLSDKQNLIQAISRLVADEMKAALAPIKERMERVEKFISDMPLPVSGQDGKEGPPGKDGKDVDMDAINDVIQFTTEKFVDARLAAWPKPQDGKDGADGKSVSDDDVKLMLETTTADYMAVVAKRVEDLSTACKLEIDRQIEALPKPKDGAPGEPGKDGADGRDGADGKNLSIDEVADHLADLVSAAVGALPVRRDCVGGFIDRDGDLSLTFSDGTVNRLGAVVGKDGKDCDMEKVHSYCAALIAAIEKPKDGKDGKDGMDGVGFDDLDFEQIDERTFAIKFVKGENRKVFNFTLSYPFFKGVWREGEYERGDCTIRDGSLFIALKNTKTTPATLHSDWVLCTKRGQDGKRGERGPAGEKGKDGRDGRDLTQRGPDGSKW